MDTLFSRVRSFLRASSLMQFAREPRVMEKAKTLIAYYYYILPFAAFLYSTNDASTRQNFQPWWPLAWAVPFHLKYVSLLLAVELLFVCTALLGVFFYRWRWVRFLVFVGLWQAHALESSFGSINHQWYMWVYTALIFVFLPDIWREEKPSIEKNHLFLLQLWSAQAMVMLLYTMAGLQKLVAVYTQATAGQINPFSMNAFAYQIADWLPQLQTEALLAPFIIYHPVWGWLPYIALIFLQFFSLWVMVRTSLQKVWAFCLVIFHIATYFTMGISFHPLVILDIILFFNSPFVPERLSLRQFVFDLPVLGQVLEWFARRKTKRA